MLTKGNWLARQLQELEAQVKVERQRLHDERRQQALSALIQLSLPELLGEVRTAEPKRDAHGESVAPRIH
jgi:hypothetical protein